MSSNSNQLVAMKVISTAPAHWQAAAPALSACENLRHICIINILGTQKFAMRQCHARLENCTISNLACAALELCNFHFLRTCFQNLHAWCYVFEFCAPARPLRKKLCNWDLGCAIQTFQSGCNMSDNCMIVILMSIVIEWLYIICFFLRTKQTYC